MTTPYERLKRCLACPYGYYLASDKLLSKFMALSEAGIASHINDPDSFYFWAGWDGLCTRYFVPPTKQSYCEPEGVE